MAITKLTELETAVADRLARSDFTTAQVDECIALTEARMQRQLRTLDMETKTEVFNLTAEYTPTPVDFLAVRDFYLNGSYRRGLEMVAPEYMTKRYGSTWLGGTTACGVPRYYAIVGKSFRVWPVPSDTSATLVYYAKIPALSTGNVTNWVLLQHPDAYLYGALMEGAIRLQDQMAATGYGNLFSSALEGIQASSRRTRYTGPSMAVRPG